MIAIPLMLIPAIAGACTCSTDWDLGLAIERAESVAVAQVVSVATTTRIAEVECLDMMSDNPEPRKCKTTKRTTVYSAVISESLKGAPVETVTVETSLNSTCGSHMSIGEAYLIVWSGEVAFTSFCGPQPRLQDVPVELLDALRMRPNNSFKPNPLRGSA